MQEQKHGSPIDALDELTRSLDHCSAKLLEIRTIVNEMEPGEIRALLRAAADRLQRESDQIRASLQVHRPGVDH